MPFFPRLFFCFFWSCGLGQVCVPVVHSVLPICRCSGTVFKLFWCCGLCFCAGRAFAFFVFWLFVLVSFCTSVCSLGVVILVLFFFVCGLFAFCSFFFWSFFFLSCGCFTFFFGRRFSLCSFGFGLFFRILVLRFCLSLIVLLICFCCYSRLVSCCIGFSFWWPVVRVVACAFSVFLLVVGASAVLLDYVFFFLFLLSRLCCVAAFAC